MFLKIFKKLFLVLIAALFIGQSTAEEKVYEKWKLAEQLHQGTDYLVYQLDYTGFFTAFVSATLADVAFFSDPKNELIDGQESCQLTMKLTTENHATAESVYPFRYQWKSKASPELDKVFLVEEIRGGVKEDYRASWLDWRNQQLELYRKRNQVLVYPEKAFQNEYELEFGDDDNEPKLVWEKGGDKEVPPILDKFPVKDGQPGYLFYEQSVKLTDVDKVLDPLGLIYAARWHDVNTSIATYNVTYRDEIREYRVKLLGKEILEIGESRVPAIKIDMMRAAEEEVEDEGFVVMWVSDDERRLPLRFEVEAPLGYFSVTLTEKSLKEYKKPMTCLSKSNRHTKVNKPAAVK